MDTKSVIARFEAERQALALMDHPNIAKVHDAGATDTGRPYFVMELVRGVKITDYCDEKNLSTQERLDLFVQVCHAVQHAHQKGIIHRDLKPSNILVNIVDGQPVPKVIDFGIAKATNDQRLTDKTVFTAFEQFIGTPAYMSPEQAEISGVDVDTRSDIYSLGVLLYELLTGKTPFDAKELLQAGLDAMRRTIREKEPERPSTRLSTLGGEELSTTAKRRGLEAPKLVNSLRGDLDWIVMKCLEKDRARRYETANGLAMDIQRHIGNEPVEACPPSSIYRIQKLVRRNRGAFAAAATITVLLFLGIGTSSWEALRARHAEREQVQLRKKAEENEKQAKANEKKAQNEGEKSDQVAFFLEKMLQGAGPSVALGRDTTVLREILDKATQSISTDLTNNPEAEEYVRWVLGKVYRDLGEIGKAEEMQRAALALARKNEGNADIWTGEMLVYLADILVVEGRLEEAEAGVREALGIFEKLSDGTDKDGSLGLAYGKLGHALRWQGRLEESAAAFRKSLEFRSKISGRNSIQAADELNNLANDIRDLGDPAQAEALLRQSLQIKRQKLPERHPSIAMTLHNLAMTLMRLNRWDEAEKVLQERLSIMKELVGEHPELVPDIVRQIGHVYGALPEVQERQGRAEEADRTRREALAYIRRTAEKLTSQSGPQTAEFLWTRGEILARLGQWTGAVTNLARACELRPGESRIWYLLAAVLVQEGDSEPYHEQRRKSLASFGSTKDATTAETIAKASLILPGAEDELRAAAVLSDAAFTLPNKGRLTWFQCCKGLADYRQGNFIGAIEWMQKVLASSGNPQAPIPMASGTDISPARDVQALAVLAMAQYKLNDPDRARATFSKAQELAETKTSKLQSGDLGNEWSEWIIAQSLLREAGDLIGVLHRTAHNEADSPNDRDGGSQANEN
jgi:tetratricopeptide (TPR) repeat protein